MTLSAAAAAMTFVGRWDNGVYGGSKNRITPFGAPSEAKMLQNPRQCWSLLLQILNCVITAQGHFNLEKFPQIRLPLAVSKK